jgi:hypothetical protein
MPNPNEKSKGEGPKNPGRLALAMPRLLQTYIEDLGAQKRSCENVIDDPNMGNTGVENAADHLRDIEWYITGLEKHLPNALFSARPERQMVPVVAEQSSSNLADSISVILNTFERYRGNRLLRGTAWHYNLSFLEALGQMRDVMLGYIILRNIRKLESDPLSALARDISTGLEESQPNMTLKDKFSRTPDVYERSDLHTFNLSIGGAPDLVITSPQDVIGFKNAIWAECVTTTGESLTFEILAHGWKYKAQAAPKVK